MKRIRQYIYFDSDMWICTAESPRAFKKSRFNRPEDKNRNDEYVMRQWRQKAERNEPMSNNFIRTNAKAVDAGLGKWLTAIWARLQEDPISSVNRRQCITNPWNSYMYKITGDDRNSTANVLRVSRYTRNAKRSFFETYKHKFIFMLMDGVSSWELDLFQLPG